jgi:hypothetical protein
MYIAINLLYNYLGYTHLTTFMVDNESGVNARICNRALINSVEQKFKYKKAFFFQT